MPTPIMNAAKRVLAERAAECGHTDILSYVRAWLLNGGTWVTMAAAVGYAIGRPTLSVVAIRRIVWRLVAHSADPLAARAAINAARDAFISDVVAHLRTTLGRLPRVPEVQRARQAASKPSLLFHLVAHNPLRASSPPANAPPRNASPARTVGGPLGV